MALVGEYGTVLAVLDGRVQLPLWTWLPTLDATAARWWMVVLTPCAVALIIGKATRAAAALLAIGLGFMFAWEQQTYSNHVALVLLLCVWVAVSPSVARSSRAARQDNVTLDRSVLLMTQLSICYLFAALAKLHPEFLSGDVLRAFTVIPLPGWLGPAAAVLTIAMELFLAVGLWLPRVRVLAAAAGVAFHLAIPFAMPTDRYGLISFSVTSLCLYPLFLTRPSAGTLRHRDPLQHRRVTAEPEV